MPTHALEIITILAIALTVIMSIRTATLRAALKINAPATIGHPDFERAFRTHVNTVENMVVFLPLLWIGATLYSQTIAFWLGAAWILGRIIYMYGYAQANADKRAPGAILTVLANTGLLIISILGVLR